jgi:hypothetical protein
VLAIKRAERKKEKLIELEEFQKKQQAEDRAFSQRQLDFIKKQRAIEDMQNEDKATEQQ